MNNFFLQKSATIYHCCSYPFGNEGSSQPLQRHQQLCQEKDFFYCITYPKGSLLVSKESRATF